MNRIDHNFKSSCLTILSNVKIPHHKWHPLSKPFDTFANYIFSFPTHCRCRLSNRFYAMTQKYKETFLTNFLSPNVIVRELSCADERGKDKVDEKTCSNYFKLAHENRSG